MLEITVLEFKLILPQICGQETSMCPEKWSSANPLFAHCLPVSLLAEKIFGKGVYSCRLLDVESGQGLGQHYYNEEVDFTVDQYHRLGYAYLAYTNEVPENASSLLTIARTRNLFEILHNRFYTHYNRQF